MFINVFVEMNIRRVKWQSIQNTFEKQPQNITKRERPKSTPYLRLKNIQGSTIGNHLEIFFQKSVWLKKSHNAEKPEKRSFRLIKRFLQT